MIIVLEGLDKAGKTTQTELLWKYLFGKYGRCMMMSFPKYDTPTGKEIEAYLSGKGKDNPEYLHILYAANRYEWKNTIEEYDMNSILIFNRYYESNLAYGRARGLDYDWLKSLDQYMPSPDLTIILDVPVNESSNRNYNPDKNEADIKFMGKVRRRFIELAKVEGWKVINADRPKDDVHKKIVKLVETECRSKLDLLNERYNNIPNLPPLQK